MLEPRSSKSSRTNLLSPPRQIFLALSGAAGLAIERTPYSARMRDQEVPATAVVVYDPDLVDPEHVALAGLLGGYRGLTRDAYALDLRCLRSQANRAGARSVSVEEENICEVEGLNSCPMLLSWWISPTPN